VGSKDLTQLRKGLITELAVHPGAVGRLLEWHRPDSEGQCLGCRQYDAPWPTWPCTVYSVAQAASVVRNTGDETAAG
jgi:hypothetical protein